jgi:hypothetical protein
VKTPSPKQGRPFYPDPDGSRPVFVGFSTPRAWNPLSALIRRMTRSPASHAWMLVEDPAFAQRLVLEAHSSGFRLVSFSRFVRENVVVALVEPAHSLGPGLRAAGAWLGEAFDVLGLFGIFLALLRRWGRQGPLRNPFPTVRALFCSEAVIRTMRAAGYPGAERLAPEGTTPADLLRFFQDEPGCVVHERADLSLWHDLKAIPEEERRAGADALAVTPSR